MGWVFGIHSYWAEGQWSIIDLTVESTVGKLCVIYDVFRPMACLIGGLGRLPPYRTIALCLDKLFDPRRFVITELVVD